MIDTNDVIALIISGTVGTSTALTNANVVRAKELEQNLQPTAALPMVFVGYATIRSKHPEAPIERPVFNTYGEDLVQSIDVVLMCPETQLVQLWTNIYAALIGQNPNPAERMHTGFTYNQGGKVALTNGKMVWIDRWNIGFPTLFTNFPRQP